MKPHGTDFLIRRHPGSDASSSWQSRFRTGCGTAAADALFQKRNDCVRGLLSDCRDFISFAFCSHCREQNELSVSVVIPCFNEAATIAAAITSVLSRAAS